MAERGITIKLNIDSSDLKQKIQNAINNATKGDGNKIVLSNFEIKSEGLRGKLQTAVNNATEKVPINLTKFHITNAGLKTMVDQVRKTIAEHPMTLEIASIDAKPAVERLRKQLATMLSGLQIGGLKEFLGETASSSALQQAAAAEEKMAEALEKVREKAVNANVALKQLSALSDILGGTKRSILNLNDADQRNNLTTIYDELIHQVQRYRELIKETGNAENTEIRATITSLEQKVVALKNSVNEQRNAEAAAQKTARANQENVASSKSVADMQARINSFVQQNSTAYTRYQSSIDKWNAQLQNNGNVTKGTLKDIESEFSAIVAIENAALGSTKTLFGSINSVWGTLMKFGIVSSFGMQITKTIKQMVSNVRELDSAMTELRKITDLSTQAYTNFQAKAAVIAKNVGASVSDTINAAADFSRLGFNIGDAAELAQAALIYKNVGEGITDVSVATKSLISTIKAFDIEATESMYIVDMFNEVGNNFAISSGGIGDALQRSAAALSTAGNTIQESIGLVTAMNSVVQDPDTVGTALKTLTMYLRAAKTDAEAAGVETDGMAESVSKLRKEIMSLTGVDIMINDTTFKSTYEVIKEISAIWSQLSDVTQANVLNLMGGKRNANVISSLLTNFDTAEAAMNDAMNALGSAFKENEEYLDSIEGKISKFTATYQELSSLVINNALIKGFIDFGTSIMNVALALEKVGLLIPTVVAGFVALRGIKIASDASRLVTQVQMLANTGMNAANIMATIARDYANLGNLGRNAFGSYIGALGNSGTIGAVASGITQLSTAQVAAAGSSRMLSTAVVGMGVAFNSIGGIITVISLILSATIGVIQKVQQGIQESIDKANEMVETYNNANESYNKNISTLDSLKSRFYELSRSVGENGTQGKLTAEEYKEYQSIIQQIIDISPSVVKGYDDEGNALVNYTNLVREARLEQEKLNQAQLATYVSGGETLFTGKKNEYKQVQNELGAAGVKLGDALSGPIWDIFGTEKRVKAWNKAVEDIGETFSHNMTWQTNYDLLSAIYDKQIAFVTSLRASGAYTDKELRNIESLIGGLASARNKLTAIEDEEIQYVKTRLEWESKQEGLTGGTDWFSDIPIAALTSLEDVIAGAIDPMASLSDNMDRARELTMAFAATFTEAAAVTEDGTKITYASIKKMIDAFDPKGSRPQDQLDAIKEAVNSFLDSIEDADLRQVMSDVFNMMIPSLSDATSGVDNLLGEYRKLSDGIKQVKNDVSILNKAQEEMENGGISSDTVQSMIDSMSDGERVSDYLIVENGVLKMNVDAWNERTTAMISGDLTTMRHNLDMLQTENDEIDRNTDALVARNLEITNRLSEIDELIESGTAGDSVEALKLEAEQLTAELYTNIETVNRSVDTYRSNDNAIKQLTADIEIYEAAYNALINTVDEEDFELDFSETNSAMDTAKDNMLKLIEMRKALADGTNLTSNDKDWITSVFPAVDIWSVEAGEQLEAIEALMLQVQGEWQDIIDNAIELYEAKVSEAQNLFGVGSEQELALQGYINTLKTLRDIDVGATWGSPDQQKTINDYVKAVQDGMNLLSSMKSGKNPLSDISSVLSMLDDLGKKDVSELILGATKEDGIQWDTTAIQTYTHNMIDAMITTEQFGDKTQAVKDYLYDFVDSEKDAADKALTMSDALSQVDASISFLKNLSDTESSPIAMIEAAMKMAEKMPDTSWTSFFSSISADGISWDAQAVKDYGHAMVDTFITMSNMTEGVEELRTQLYALVDAENSAAGHTASMSDAFGAIDNVSSLLTNFKEGKADFLGIIKSLTSMAEDWNKIRGEDDQLHWWDFAEVKDNNSIAWSTEKMREYSDAMIDSAFAADEAGKAFAAAHPEIVNLIKAQARATQEATDNLESLKSTMSNTKSGIGLIQDVLSEQTTKGVNSLDTLSSLIGLVGDKWSSMVNWTDDGPIIQIDKVVQYLDAEIDALKGVDDAQKQVMKSAIAAAVEGENAAKSVVDIYGNLSSLMKNAGATSENIELTYSAYKDLIEIDSRYATAVEYQNGVLTLNRDAYEQVTNAVLEEAKAKAESEKAALMATEAYLSGDQAVLAQVRGYDVLISELNNATNAINRFKRASSDTKSDMFSTAQEAAKVIEDTLYKSDSDIYGKVGREQYQAAIEFLILPDVDVDSAEFEKAFALIQSYLKDGGQGVQTFIDDMVQNGIIDKETGALNESLDVIASKLGITTDFLRAMIEEYNQYAKAENRIQVDYDDAFGDTTDGESEAKTIIDKMTEVKTAVDEVNTALSQENIISVDTDDAVKNVNSLSAALTILAGKISAVANSRINVNVDSSASASGAAALSGTRGARYAAGGRTLVGELGMETVVDPKTNTWYTVGANGAEFVNLPKGAVVFNAEQTKRLFANGRAGSYGNAMAGGTENAHGNVNTNITPPVHTTSTPTGNNGIKNLMKEYEQLDQQLEHILKHQEYLYEVAERNMDMNGMAAALTEKVRIYKQQLDKAKEVVEQMQKSGLDDLDSNLQKMEEAQWEAERNMLAAMRDLNNLYVDALDNRIDEIQSAYDRLSNATEQFAQNGGVTVDMFQDLMRNGLQYMQFLEKVNGQYQINKKGIEDLLRTEVEQQAVESALAYLSNIRDAMLTGNANTVDYLISGNASLSSATWSVVDSLYAEVVALGLTQEQAEMLLGTIDKIKDISTNVSYGSSSYYVGSGTSLTTVQKKAKDIEHIIEHLKQEFKEAQRALDYGGMESSLTSQAERYREIAETYRVEVERMKKSYKYAESSETFQDYERSMWDATNSMYDVLDELYKLYVDGLNNQIDGLQNGFSRLSNAADEFNQYGGITVDTFQELLNNGVQYLSLLDNLDGEYTINEERVRELINAETSQLAVEKALSYLAQVRQALVDNNTNKLKQLAGAYEEIGKSTWAAVDAALAELKVLGLSGEEYVQITKNVEALKDISTTLADETAIATKRESASIDYILNKTKELIKYETNQQIEALKAQNDEYKKMVDEKKKLLSQTKEESSYEDEIAEKVKDIAKIQMKIDKLSLDDSRKAAAERAALMEELTEKQKDLNEAQSDHAYDTQMEALDKLAKASDDDTDARIEELQKSISSEEKLYQAAIERIKEGWDTLYDELIAWNYEAGSVLNDEITEGWNTALAAAKKYGSYVEALAASTTTSTDNKVASGSLVVANVPKYHSGGIVGDEGSISRKEVVAILNKGEGVLNENGMNGLYTLVDFASMIADKFGTSISEMSSLSVSGVHRDIVGGISGNVPSSNSNMLNFNPVFNVNVAGASEGEAKSIGRRIAENALDVLCEAFEKRGISSIGNRKLKQA